MHLNDERESHLWFLENLDRVNRALQLSSDLDRTMSDVLDAVLSVFACDRAWLVHPCDPEAQSWRAVMEHTRPEYPGAFALGRELPMDAEVASVFRAARSTPAAVRIGAPGAPVPAVLAERFQIRSIMAAAVYPKGDRPYLFGLHQCSRDRVWTDVEERLFQEVARRLGDVLTSLLMYRNLRESERRLDEAQRLAHIGYWDRDLHTGRVMLSGETCAIFGFGSEDQTLDLRDWHEHWVKLIHPEDRPKIAAALRSSLEGGPRYDVEYRVVRRTGDVRVVHSRGDVVRDAEGRPCRMFGMMQDITERRRSERRLLAHHQLTQTLAEARTLDEAAGRLLEAVGEPLEWDVGALWQLDPQRGVLRALEAWRRPEVNTPRFEAATRELAFGPGQGMPGRVWATREAMWIPDVATDGAFVRAACAAAEGLHTGVAFPILLGGNVLGVVDFFSRETRGADGEVLAMLANAGMQIGQFVERRRAEQALKDVRAEIVRVTRLLTMGELTAAIAHEVKQPLAAVVAGAGACERWLARNPPEIRKVRETLPQICEDAQRAAAVIDRIRALVSRAAPVRANLDLNEVIGEVLAIIASEAQQHRVVVRTSLSPALPPARGDRVQLQQVLLNLALNGIQAMSSIADRARELRIDSRQVGGEVVVAVEDQGVGLTPDDAERLFEPFSSTKPGGMGMGLAISRRIVEAHGGRLWASSNEGGGATFRFALPCATRENQASAGS